MSPPAFRRKVAVAFAQADDLGWAHGHVVHAREHGREPLSAVDRFGWLGRLPHHLADTVKGCPDTGDVITAMSEVAAYAVMHSRFGALSGTL